MVRVKTEKGYHNKAPRSKLRGINTALQAAGYRQPSLQAAGNLPEEIKG